MAELCQRLDHVIDCIEEVLQVIYINNVTNITDEAISFAEKICSCTAKMKAMLTELPYFRKSEMTPIDTVYMQKTKSPSTGAPM